MSKISYVMLAVLPIIAGYAFMLLFHWIGNAIGTLFCFGITTAWTMLAMPFFLVEAECAE